MVVLPKAWPDTLINHELVAPGHDCCALVKPFIRFVGWLTPMKLMVVKIAKRGASREGMQVNVDLVIRCLDLARCSVAFNQAPAAMGCGGCKANPSRSPQGSLSLTALLTLLATDLPTSVSIERQWQRPCGRSLKCVTRARLSAREPH
jgi:hypothetical protein